MGGKIIRILCIVLLLCILLSAFSLAQKTSIKYTNRDEVSFRGTADPESEVKIFVNGEEYTTVQTDGAGNWIARDVPMDSKLKENMVYAKAFDNSGMESPYSRKIKIIVDKIPPKVTITVEPNKVKGGEQVRLSLKANEDVKNASVAAPDNNILNLSYDATKATWEGVWDVPLRFTTGVYQFVGMATDLAGNIGKGKSNPVNIDTGVGLSIVSPEPWALVYEDRITVQGIAENLPFVELNDKQVMVRPDNTFAGEVALPKPGHNIIAVVGRDAASEVKRIEQTIVKLITFPDIQTHWAKKEIEFLATLGYVEAGNEDGLFLPDQPIRRSEMASVVIRAKNYPVGSFTKSTFRDIMENHWAMNYIETGYQYGILKGYPDHEFHPNTYLNRAEGATVITRMADFPLLTPKQPPALDVPSDHWAAKYIYTFQRNGLIPPPWKGKSRFYPKVPMSRAEFVAALARTPQVNRAIAHLINRNPEFEVVVDEYGKQRIVKQGDVALQQGKMYKSIVEGVADEEGSANKHFVQVKVSPQEVRPGTSVHISVASWRKLTSVIAVAPNEEVIALKYNKNIDRFEGYWKVPNVDHLYGNYVMKVKAVDFKGEVYRVDSNKFAIVAIPQMMVPQEAKPEKSMAIEIPVEGSSEIVFAEYAETGASGKTFEGIADGTKTESGSALQPSSVQRTGFVTRAQFAQFLVDIGKVPTAKKIKFVAKDVGIDHPQAAAINACLLKNYMKLDAQKKFNPNGAVSRAFTAVALTRAKNVALPSKLIKDPFKDVSRKYWAAPHIYKVTKLGWMKPVTATMFYPKNNIDQKEFEAIRKRIK
ncbi:S-layer homology domain-containing protein [Candidatus Margulisiibacteriota bacterium]